MKGKKNIQQSSGSHSISAIIPMVYTSFLSPLGTMFMTSDGHALTGLWFEGQINSPFSYSNSQRSIINLKSSYNETLELHSLLFQQTIEWLNAYFHGKPLQGMPPLAPNGSDFRKAVWKELLTIGWGQTSTYGEIAKHIGQQRGNQSMSAQAVGNAINHNPISILIPCHRVIGSDGHLTGYAGGIDKKQWLLRHESLHPSSSNIFYI